MKLKLKLSRSKRPNHSQNLSLGFCSRMLHLYLNLLLSQPQINDTLVSTREGAGRGSTTTSLELVKIIKTLKRNLRTRHTTSVKEEAKRGWPNSTAS